jgi:hypothetical protein
MSNLPLVMINDTSKTILNTMNANSDSDGSEIDKSKKGDDLKKDNLKQERKMKRRI